MNRVSTFIYCFVFGAALILALVPLRTGGLDSYALVMIWALGLASTVAGVYSLTRANADALVRRVFWSGSGFAFIFLFSLLIWIFSSLFDPGSSDFAKTAALRLIYMLGAAHLVLSVRLVSFRLGGGVKMGITIVGALVAAMVVLIGLAI